MKVSEIIKKVNKDIDNEVDFPISIILNELSLPYPNNNENKTNEIIDKFKGYFILKSSDIYLTEKNIITYFYSDEFICISEYGIFYWKDEETYFKIKDILRSLHKENSEIKIYNVNKEMSDSYKVKNIRDVRCNSIGHIDNKIFEVLRCYFGEEKENDYIEIRFVENGEYRIFNKKDVNKLNFYYNIEKN